LAIFAAKQKGNDVTDPTRVKADLIPFRDEYTRDVLSWLDSEETLWAVCRSKEFPPSEDLVRGWQRKGVGSFILMSENKPVAYAELWNRPLETAVEITHLVVAPGKRGMGYGTKMLQLLFDRAAQRSDIAKVLLNLYDENEAALGCYLKAGFEVAGMSRHVTGIRMVRMVR
jgi:ribosomal protein S18 acetylase RimI-like enzyme